MFVLFGGVSFSLSFLGSFLALLENIHSERLFLVHAPLVTLGAYPSVPPRRDSSPNLGEPFCFGVS